jgi:hypothetical protein
LRLGLQPGSDHGLACARAGWCPSIPSSLGWPGSGCLPAALAGSVSPSSIRFSAARARCTRLFAVPTTQPHTSAAHP